MITVDHHLRALTEFNRRVRAIGIDGWGLPVPTCPEWDVTALVEHVTLRTAWTARLIAGGTPEQVADFVDRHCNGGDGALASWRRVFVDACAVLDQVSLDRDVSLPGGPLPATSYLAEVCCDTVVHTWDLAIAVGADPRLDGVLVDACDDWLAAIEEDWRRRGAIGARAPVPARADPQEALLARVGRRSEAHSA